MLDLALQTIIVPIVLGAMTTVAALLGARGWRFCLTFTIAVVIFYIYQAGALVFPPISSKHKLLYVIAAAAPVALLQPAARRPGQVWLAAFALAALVWIGWPRIASGAWLTVLAVLASTVVFTMAAPTIAKGADRPFVWPATVIAYTIGASILSLFGFFVGFGQTLGGLAALLGGLTATVYGLQIIGGKTLVMPPSLLAVMALTSIAAAMVVGLYAPELNHAAFAVLALTFAVPLLAPDFKTVPEWARPLLFGLLAAGPVLVAIAIAWLA